MKRLLPILAASILACNTNEAPECPPVDGMRGVANADDYEFTRHGTPGDGQYTVQEVVNFWHRASDNTWQGAVDKAAEYDFDLNRFLSRHDSRSEIVSLDEICTGALPQTLTQRQAQEPEQQAAPQRDNIYHQALAYVIRWSQDERNCVSSYLPTVNGERYSMGDALERIDFGEGVTRDELERVQELVTPQDLATAYNTQQFTQLFNRLKRNVDTFSDSAACDGRELKTIGEEQFEALYQSFVLALQVREAGAEFPVIDYRRSSNNFAQDRRGDRVHAAQDLNTYGQGRVKAMANGEVIATSDEWTETHNFKTCRGNRTGFVAIHHPELGIIANYAELDIDDTERWNPGDEISQGDLIGNARHCGMLHLEAYAQDPETYVRWRSSDQARPGEIQFNEEALADKPDHIIDPTAMLYLLERER